MRLIFCSCAASVAVTFSGMTLATAGTAPTDYFSEAIAIVNNSVDSDYVNPIPDISTGQIGGPSASITSPRTSFYVDDSGGYNYDGIGTWISNGISTATADRATGQLHAEAGPTLVNPLFIGTGFPGAQATSAFGDTLTLSGATPDTNVIDFSVHVDGTLTSIAPGEIVGSPGSPLASASLQVIINEPDCYVGGFCPSVSDGELSQATQLNESWALVDENLTIDDTLTGTITLTGSTATFPFLAIFTAYGTYGLANFADTASFSFDLPTGVSLTSASGDFLTDGAPAVPEPSTWASILLGFAGLAFARRGIPRVHRWPRVSLAQGVWTAKSRSKFIISISQ